MDIRFIAFLLMSVGCAHSACAMDDGLSSRDVVCGKAYINACNNNNENKIDGVNLVSGLIPMPVVVLCTEIFELKNDLDKNKDDAEIQNTLAQSFVERYGGNNPSGLCELMKTAQIDDTLLAHIKLDTMAKQQEQELNPRDQRNQNEPETMPSAPLYEPLDHHEFAPENMLNEEMKKQEEEDVHYPSLDLEKDDK